MTLAKRRAPNMIKGRGSVYLLSAPRTVAKPKLCSIMTMNYDTQYTGTSTGFSRIINWLTVCDTPQTQWTRHNVPFIATDGNPDWEQYRLRLNTASMFVYDWHGNLPGKCFSKFLAVACPSRLASWLVVCSANEVQLGWGADIIIHRWNQVHT